MTAREVIRDWVRNPRDLNTGKFQGDHSLLRVMGEPLIALGNRAATVAERDSADRWTRTQERYARVACVVLEEEGWTVFRGACI